MAKPKPTYEINGEQEADPESTPSAVASKKWRSSSDGKMKWNDMRLNKSGTVGTEPISKNGDRYTELKFGKLGAIDVPTAGTVAKKLENVGSRIRKGAQTLAADVKKNGFTPMNDAGIYNKGKK